MHRKDWLGSRGNDGRHRRERIKRGYLCRETEETNRVRKKQNVSHSEN